MTAQIPRDVWRPAGPSAGRCWPRWKAEALRAYWSEGLRLIPDLRFEVLGVYAGVSTVVVNYRNQAGGLVCEVLTFDGPLVIQGHGTYPAQAPIGLKE
jgi:hypothetical protein